MNSEFVVSAEKRDDVTKRLSRIQDLFGVRVQCGEPGGSPCGDSGCILPSDAGDPDLAGTGSDSSTFGSSSVWVLVIGDSKQACEKAKEYILSVCSDRRIEEDYTRQTLDMLDGRIPLLEYDSGAVIERLPGDKLRIQGSDENIVRAQSLISMKTNAVAHGLENGAIHVRREPFRMVTASSRTDFCDSSNSAQEGESEGKAGHLVVENGSPRVAPRDELQTKAVPSSSTSTSSSSSSSLAKSNSQNKHEDIIALMLKLGYSRQIVEQVLLQCGDQASSDEVLRMLVNLGSPKITEDSGSDTKEPEGASRRKDFCDGVDESEDADADPYRPIIIDGSNVAMSFGNSNVFDCQGIHTVVMWFFKRGHKIIYVFVPSWRKEQSKPETPIKDQEILIQLEKSKILVWTPSRRVKGRRMVCYDDRYILNLAHELDGIVVSNDTFRDLCAEKPEHRKVVEERLLMYSFAGDKFMPPDDPLGRHGPSLENFLRKTPTKPSHQMQLCPYGKKCTYGNKCKYSHPERSRNVKTTSEILVEKDRQRQEEKLKANLLARAHKTDMVEMPWEREDAKGRSSTVPLLKHSAARSSAMLHGGAIQQHEGAVTVPLRNPPMPDTSMNTVPLMGSQHMQQVSGYGMHPQNLQSVNEGWLPPDQRVPASYPHPHSQTHSSTMNQHQHQVTSPPQLRNQPLLNRSSLTAPLTSYTPHSHPPRDMMTAPLSAHEYYQHHASQQAGKRYSLPTGGVEQQRVPLQQVHPSFQRDRSNIGDISQEFHHMSLSDTTSHVSTFDDERHYSYPLSAPYRGTPVLTNQTPTNPYVDDEGYYSPITPKDQSIPSPVPLSHPPSSSRHSLHPNSDSIAPPAQSHPSRFRYPSSASSVPPASSTSVPYTSLPPPPSNKPPGPHQIPGGAGGTDPHSYRGHLGVPQVPPRHIAHSMGSPRRTSEPVPQRQVWGDGQERLPDALRQLPGEDDASLQEMMRRASSGLQGQP